MAERPPARSVDTGRRYVGGGGIGLLSCVFGRAHAWLGLCVKTCGSHILSMLRCDKQEMQSHKTGPHRVDKSERGWWLGGVRDTF